MAGDLEVNGEGLLIAIRQPIAGDIDWNEFISLGFTHHMEILSKTKDISERLFYIHECAVRAWDKYTLREYIRAGLYRLFALNERIFLMRLAVSVVWQKEN